MKTWPAENKVMRKEMNFRDLGDLVTKDGRRIRKNLFYRSALPALMNGDELKELERLGIHTILDLRTDYEAYAVHDPEIQGMEYYRVSGMRDPNGTGVDYSPRGMQRMEVLPGETMEEHSARLYTAMVHHNQAFQFLLLEQQETNLMPVLFHCHTGKDRTGALAMLIEMALGVETEELMKDFLYSNVSFREKINAAMKEAEQQEPLNEADRKSILAVNGVLEERGMMMIESILNEYGSFDTFLDSEYGLDRNALKRIRDQYLEK